MPVCTSTTVEKIAETIVEEIAETTVEEIAETTVEEIADAFSFSPSCTSWLYDALTDYG